MHRVGDYEALPGINWSRLREMRVSPLQYKYSLTAKREETEALRVGLAAHSFLLEPELFKDRFCCYRASKSVGDGARKNWQAFQAENEHKTILSPDEYDRAVGAASAVMAHPVAATYFTGGAKEVAWQWTDPDTGLLLKGRADQWLRRLVELKTTRHVLPRLFAADAARLGYVEQASFYHTGLVAHGVDLEPGAVIVAVQSEPPHDVVPYELPDDLLQVGRDRCRELLARVKQCLETDSWPGVAEHEVPLEMPPWFFPQDDLTLVMPDGGEVTL